MYHDEMVCDLAQYYHIYDYHTIPVNTLAILVSGLDDSSRVKRAAGGVKVSPSTLFMAGIFDDLNALLWNGKSKKPGRILPTLYVSNDEDDNKSDIVTYDSPEDLRKRREEIMKQAQEEKAAREDR